MQLWPKGYSEDSRILGMAELWTIHRLRMELAKKKGFVCYRHRTVGVGLPTALVQVIVSVALVANHETDGFGTDSACFLVLL